MVILSRRRPGSTLGRAKTKYVRVGHSHESARTIAESTSGLFDGELAGSQRLLQILKILFQQELVSDHIALPADRYLIGTEGLVEHNLEL